MFTCILPGGAIPEMTCTVSGGTLNPTHLLKLHYFVKSTPWSIKT